MLTILSNRTVRLAAAKRTVMAMAVALAAIAAHAQAVPGGDTPLLLDDHHKGYIHHSFALGYEAYNDQYGIGALAAQYSRQVLFRHTRICRSQAAPGLRQRHKGLRLAKRRLYLAA